MEPYSLVSLGICFTLAIGSFFVFRRKYNRKYHLNNFKLQKYSEIITTVGSLFEAFENCILELNDAPGSIINYTRASEVISPIEDTFRLGDIFKLQLRAGAPFFPPVIVEQFDQFYWEMVEVRLLLSSKILGDAGCKKIFLDIHKLDFQFNLIVNMMQQDLGMDLLTIKERSFGVLNFN